MGLQVHRYRECNATRYKWTDYRVYMATKQTHLKAITVWIYFSSGPGHRNIHWSNTTALCLIWGKFLFWDPKKNLIKLQCLLHFKSYLPRNTPLFAFLLLLLFFF